MSMTMWPQTIQRYSGIRFADLEIQGGQGTRVFHNTVYENNTANFAPEGAIVGNVPAGTGLLILANDNIEIFENTFEDNNNVNLMVYSFCWAGAPSTPNYDPYPEQIYIDNQYGAAAVSRPTHYWPSGTRRQATSDIVWGGLSVTAGPENLICLEKRPRKLSESGRNRQSRDTSTDAEPARLQPAKT